MDLELIIESLRGVKQALDNTITTLELSNNSLDTLNKDVELSQLIQDHDMGHLDYATINSYGYPMKVARNLYSRLNNIKENNI